jgi:hypothetical protein
MGAQRGEDQEGTGCCWRRGHRLRRAFGDLSVLPSVRYCITLELRHALPATPRANSSASRCTLEPSALRAIAGCRRYGVLQPRVMSRCRAAGRASGSPATPASIPTTAVSTPTRPLREDLHGKVVSDVDAFKPAPTPRSRQPAALPGPVRRLPHARRRLGRQVVEDYPPTCSSTRRQRRWTRRLAAPSMALPGVPTRGAANGTAADPQPLEDRRQPPPQPRRARVILPSPPRGPSCGSPPSDAVRDRVMCEPILLARLLAGRPRNSRCASFSGVREDATLARRRSA